MQRHQEHFVGAVLGLHQCLLVLMGALGGFPHGDEYAFHFAADAVTQDFHMVIAAKGQVFAQLALAVWQGCAFTIIIYLSGLQTIPSELYEAASLDGASSWRQFWAITFPLISAFFTNNVVLSLKGYLQVFDPIVALTNGGPGTATRSVAMTIIAGFNGGDYAYQMANATIFFIVAVVISILQLSLTRGRNQF